MCVVHVAEEGKAIVHKQQIVEALIPKEAGNICDISDQKQAIFDGTYVCIALVFAGPGGIAMQGSSLQLCMMDKCCQHDVPGQDRASH